MRLILVLMALLIAVGASAQMLPQHEAVLTANGGLRLAHPDTLGNGDVIPATVYNNMDFKTDGEFRLVLIASLTWGPSGIIREQSTWPLLGDDLIGLPYLTVDSDSPRPFETAKTGVDSVSAVLVSGTYLRMSW